MVKEPLRRRGAGVGDAAVQAATGRRPEDWFALLDGVGATAWAHPAIARWLADEHGVDPWWCQSLTVAYEQARGLRAPGQRSDGTFEATATKVLPVDAAEAFAWLTEPDLRRRWLDVDPDVRGSIDIRTVRWGWPDGSFVTAHLDVLADGRSRVAVQHRGLPDAATHARWKEYWVGRMGALHGAVSAGR